MKNTIIASLTILAFLPGAYASPTDDLPEIDWNTLKSQAVELQVNDPAVALIIASKIGTAKPGRLRLKVESFYQASLKAQDGFPGAKLSISDVLAGKEPDRFNMHYTVCGEELDTASEKSLNRAIANDVGLGASGIAGMSNGYAATIGAVAGLAATLLTPGKKTLSCEEKVTVCPISSNFCTWDELVMTDFVLYDGDKKLAHSYTVTVRIGRGFESKAVTETHLKELEAL